ncbi:ATP-binding cassette domain-containing protein [Marinomonas sp.]|uniref:ATP-binding cassette domain-containing protein n=1 Tax=Marinomonas sp. TaxID=1904862 RepID=UPI003BAB299A
MLVVSDLSFILPNGDALFSHLSFSCAGGISAIIGRNGVGKSTLLECIAQQQLGVAISGTYSLFRQSSSDNNSDKLRVIDALRLGNYYDALRRVEHGEPLDTDVDLLEQHWDVVERAQAWLMEANLPLELELPMQSLSGGQRTKVQLIGLLQQSPDVLLLDEPSNHLDKQSTQWLIRQLKETPSTVLLVSHDVSLLNSIKKFLVLDETGIHPFHMDFINLRTQLEKHHHDSIKAISQVKAQLKKEQREQQAREQKAQQRLRQGEAERASGNQSKLLLDRRKNKAQAKRGAQARMAEQRSLALKKDLQQQQGQQIKTSTLNLHLSSQNKGQRRVLDLIDAVLPFGDKTPLSIFLDRGERLRIDGPNGSGKSTLIQCVQGLQTLKSGELSRHVDTLYLDQHLSLLDQFTSPFALLKDRATHLDDSTIRTFLGSIGLRGDHAFLPCSALSGGERMKVALLLISQIPSEGILILDETDNHLDLDSQDQLAATLDNYQGALIFVTHQDKWIRADKIVALKNKKTE